MEDDFLKGGAHNLSGVLERRTKEDPERFARLALRFPDHTHHYYVDAVLRGVAEAGPSTETLLKVCRRCHELPRRPSGRWICYAVESAPGPPLTSTRRNDTLGTRATRRIQLISVRATRLRPRSDRASAGTLPPPSPLSSTS
jgi:hypothetical protein